MLSGTTLQNASSEVVGIRINDLALPTFLIAGTTPAMSLVRQIWPHLNCILTVTTGAFRPYADTLNLKYVMDSVPFFSPLYAATEGLIGVNISPEDNQDATYALLPQALFYEFLEVASNNFTISSDNNNINKKRKTLLSNQLEIGRKYELVITNLAGSLCSSKDVTRC